MGISSIKRERMARALRPFPVSKVQLFGSRARGEARRGSDYDLLIHFRADYTPSLFELGGLHHTLTERWAPTSMSYPTGVPYRRPF